jgi:uncharacterized protein YbaP (TraB family)
MGRLVWLLVAMAGCVTEVNAQLPLDKTLLWEVSGNGISKPSYLFGTIHLMCPDELQVPAIVKDKFEGTQQLFLEIDMDDPNLMKEVMRGMQMHDNNTLEGLMGKNFDSANAKFQSTTGFSLKMLNSAKPFLLMSMIYPTLLGCQPKSWEAEFQKMAKQKNVEIKGLEKISDQINVFEKIPYKVQSEMLLKLLHNLDSSKVAFTTMLNIYKTKDINRLHEISTNDKDFGEYEGTLLNDRNHNWIPVIGEQAKKMPTFFAFGAGHLGGDKGVINLLRKVGYTVKPLFYQ